MTIVTVVSSKNIRELEQIADLSRRIGADKIGFIPQHSITSAPAPFDVTCRDEAAAQSVGGAFSRMRARGIAIDNSREYLDMFDDAFRGKKLPIKCCAGRASLVVDCYHNIFPCWPIVEAGRPVENLRTMDIAEVWRSKEYESVRRWTESCRACFWNCHAELSILCRGIR